MGKGCCGKIKMLGFAGSKLTTPENEEGGREGASWGFCRDT